MFTGTWPYWRNTPELSVPIKSYIFSLDPRNTEGRLKREVQEEFLSTLGKYRGSMESTIKELGINVYVRSTQSMVWTLQDQLEIEKINILIGEIDEKKADKIPNYRFDWHFNYLDNGKRKYIKGQAQELFDYVFGLNSIKLIEELNLCKFFKETIELNKGSQFNHLKGSFYCNEVEEISNTLIKQFTKKVYLDESKNNQMAKNWKLIFSSAMSTEFFLLSHHASRNP